MVENSLFTMVALPSQVELRNLTYDCGSVIARSAATWRSACYLMIRARFTKYPAGDPNTDKPSHICPPLTLAFMRAGDILFT